MHIAHVRIEEHQAFGCLLKLHEQLGEDRTAVSNQAHGFLLEFGIQQKKGRGRHGQQAGPYYLGRKCSIDEIFSTGR
ncbi:hypothetical protein [Rheinheimera sp. 1928-s]|uniref:hypothetical protein n=1 Tax=Rheinheimera sp. 1928-s TaxID=3033803 RepID=UPI00260AB8D3|nr:hypothetical protein [Rheinheimera sp. 1928-s]MDF3127047.1 hypothetical protein [Rheinheimera sp. 1928-s]